MKRKLKLLTKNLTHYLNHSFQKIIRLFTSLRSNLLQVLDSATPSFLKERKRETLSISRSERTFKKKLKLPKKKIPKFVGLVIAIIARGIVVFVLGKVNV